MTLKDNVQSLINYFKYVLITRLPATLVKQLELIPKMQ